MSIEEFFVTVLVLGALTAALSLCGTLVNLYRRLKRIRRYNGRLRAFRSISE